MPIVPLRKWGRWASAIIVVAAFVAFIVSLRHAQIAWGDVPKFFTYHTMIQGLYQTILLTIACMATGIILGVVIAIMRRSTNPVMSWLAWLYIYIFRGLPALLQLYIWFNLALAFKTIGIPGLVSISTNTVITPFVAGVLGLGLNESAYYAEIVRAGFNSVDHGQVEAAASIGMRPSQTMRRVILPQAMRVIIPPTGNDFINMIKGTSLASVIGVHELLLSASNIYAANFRIMEALMSAALWYMVIVSLASIGQYWIEKKYASDRSNPATMKKVMGRSLNPNGFFRRMIGRNEAIV
ncbi:MAG: amino acid ABC transporter permease [Acidobacteria bacterium]|nr:amino acid ABC transporter permease [Acidobacteriota bacterium]